MKGSFGKEIPQVTSIPVNEETVTEAMYPSPPTPPTPEKGFFEKAGGKLADTFNPMKREINPEFAKTKRLFEYSGNPLSDEQIISLGIPKESSFMYQYGPLAYAGLTALPLAEQYLGPQEGEVEPETSQNLYAMNPSQYQIGSITGYSPQGYFMAAEGGEVTGFAEGGGQRIEHPDGKVKDHPKRIGEIVGRGTGTSDDIPAMLSDGEFVMTAQAVRNAGGGSRKVGAKNMYKMMKSLENGGSLSQQSIGMA